MTYYFSPGASRSFYNPIVDIVQLVNFRMMQGFIPWLLRSLYGNKPKEYRHLNLPIFFVTEEDLGHLIIKNSWVEVPTPSLILPMNYWKRSDEDFFYSLSIKSELPEIIDIPNIDLFNYQYDGIIRELEEIVCGQEQDSSEYRNKDCHIERVASFDWLGLYYGYLNNFRCIFIRIEAIMNNPLLNGYSPLGINNNAIGGASIVLHELGHAILDPDISYKPLGHLHSCKKISSKAMSTIEYIMDEAMANLFAFRSIRGNGLTKHHIGDIQLFMKGQPFPYALGERIGDSIKTYHQSLDFHFQTYITRWYKAKSGRIPITNYLDWTKLILSKSPFNDVDIRNQYTTLFS